MLLLTAATNFEMAAFVRACPVTQGIATLVTGVGPVETSVRLSAFLATAATPPTAVVNIGVAGAYVVDGREQVSLLDICLAEREVLADLGICVQDEVHQLRGGTFELVECIELDASLLGQASKQLTVAQIPHRIGVFATVNCVSGTQKRGEVIARQHRAICENMEGFAAAMACRHFGVPLLELRCISNLVEDRHCQNWQLSKACNRCGEVAALIVSGLRDA